MFEWKWVVPRCERFRSNCWIFESSHMKNLPRKTWKCSRLLKKDAECQRGQEAIKIKMYGCISLSMNQSKVKMTWDERTSFLRVWPPWQSSTWGDPRITWFACLNNLMTSVFLPIERALGWWSPCPLILQALVSPTDALTILAIDLAGPPHLPCSSLTVSLFQPRLPLILLALVWPRFTSLFHRYLTSSHR